MTQKIVINKCYGGFGLSHKAVMRYAELAGITIYAFVGKADVNHRPITIQREHDRFPQQIKEPYNGQKNSLIHYSTKPLDNDGLIISDSYWSYCDLERDNPILVQVVEELGEEAYGDYAKLKVVEVPDDVQWEIGEYDGMERVEEMHEKWY